MRIKALCTTAALATGLLFAALPVSAAPGHGLSAFGELKYPADFTHFDYVNPDAPKGGTLSMIGTGAITTFNSFNGFIVKGDAAQGIGFLFDSLMTGSADEPDSVYGLVAHSAELSDDRKSVSFFMHPEARFSDGSKLTADDVLYSFDILREKGHPAYRLQLRDVVKAEKLDDYTVKYTFKGEQVRDLPRIVATLPIFSKAFYSKVPFDETNLKPPVGSGPYKIAKFEQGRNVTYERRKDYWAKDLPVNRGRYNFEVLRYEYFRDSTAAFEALKSRQYDLREEFSSKGWATAYNIPQVKSGKLKREMLPDKSPSGAQGFFLNTRREKFADRRVRRAFDLAFDFEWTSKNLFFNAYQRTASFFENSDLKAEGKPAPDELALLEPFRTDLPKEVFETPYTPPKTDGSGRDRNNLRLAQKLLREAGWTVSREPVADEECGIICKIMKAVGLRKSKREAILRNEKGESFDVEFLIYTASFERVIQPYIRNLRTLGIKGRIRKVDSSQYQRRVKDFDFDITTSRYSLGLTPGVQMRNFWSSRAAGVTGSYNLSGIKSPVVDALIEKMIDATNRAELRTAAKALDRVLRAGYYWVPQWYHPFHRMAYWDKFGKPAQKPPYDRAVIDTWWVDKEKEAKLEEG